MIVCVNRDASACPIIQLRAPLLRQRARRAPSRRRRSVRRPRRRQRARRVTQERVGAAGHGRAGASTTRSPRSTARSRNSSSATATPSSSARCGRSKSGRGAAVDLRPRPVRLARADLKPSIDDLENRRHDRQRRRPASRPPRRPPSTSIRTPIVIASDAEAIAVAKTLAAEFAVDAAKRDRERILPAAELTDSPRAGYGASPCPRPMAARAFPSRRWRK